MTLHQGSGESGGGGPPLGTSPVADDEISLWEVLAVLLRRRVLIVRTVFVVVLVAVAVAFARHRTWTTTASFRPQGSSGASELAALASQFGVNVGARDEGESPAFYQEVLSSREILARVAAESYESDQGSRPLADLLDIRAETPQLRLARTVEWLRDEGLSVSTGRETGIVTVSVKSRWPAVSLGIADRLLAEVSRFNLETRQSQARAERDFIEARVAAAAGDLQTAEENLQEFLRNNRVVGEFSQAKLEFDRLQREVLNRQQVYSTLVQSYEQARITEVRDTPVLTVLQSPYLPPEPDGRGLVLGAALGVVLGGMMGVILAFLVEVFQRPDASDPARRDFQEAWAGLRRSLPFGPRA